MREAEYEAALTMRVLAAIEPDPDERENSPGRRQQILAKLRVVWTPDLLSTARGAPDAAGVGG